MFCVDSKANEKIHVGLFEKLIIQRKLQIYSGNRLDFLASF